MQMRGVIKIPIPSPPPPPPPPPAPAPIPIFDYIIDIYADKVVVTDAYGNTVATLGTVSDLNNWLKNVRGKKIRINVNVVVTNDIELTQNEYWIFGEWINANVYILERNTTIYSWAPMGNAGNWIFVSNWDPNIGDYVDASGLRLYAFTYADIDIEGVEGVFTVQNIVIYVACSSTSYVMYASGDVYINGGYIWISDSVLRNVYIVAWTVLHFYRTSGDGGNWVLISYSTTYVEQVSLSDVLSVYMNLTHYHDTAVNPNSSVTIGLLKIDTVVPSYYIKTIGSIKVSIQTGTKVLEPLPSGVTWSINLSTAQLTITNDTAEQVNVRVIYTAEISLG